MTSIVGVGSFSASDFDAELRAAMQIRSEIEANRRQRAQLDIQAMLAAGEMRQRSRELSLRQEEASAELAFRKEQATPLIELNRLQLQEATEERTARESAFQKIEQSIQPPSMNASDLVSSLQPGVELPPEIRARLQEANVRDSLSFDEALERAPLTTRERIAISRATQPVRAGEANIEQSPASAFASRAGGQSALVRAEADLAEIKAKYGTDVASKVENFGNAVESIAKGHVTPEQLEQLKSSAITSAQFAYDPRNPNPPRLEPTEFIKNVTGIDVGIRGQNAARRALEAGEVSEAKPDLMATIDAMLPSISGSGGRSGRIRSAEEAVNNGNFKFLEKAIANAEKVLGDRNIEPEALDRTVEQAIEPMLISKATEVYKIKNGHAVSLSDVFAPMQQYIGPTEKKALKEEMEAFNRLVDKYNINLIDSE